MVHLADCPHTRVIGLYLETIRRGREFIETARSIVPHKPIVAFYVGGSEAGKRAGLSHTGALAGPDPLYAGVFRQCGIIRAHSIPELFDFCWVLGACPQVRGNRVLVQTHSGGPGAAAADASSRAGLDLPPLTRKTLARLAQMVPHTGSLNNPVDVTFSKNPQDFFEGIPDALLADDGADGLLAYILAPTKSVRRSMIGMGFAEADVPQLTEKLFDDQGKAMAGLIEKHRKPLIGFTFQDHQDLAIKKLLHYGVPILPSPDRAARAMAALVRYSYILDTIKAPLAK
jgi:acyl-CoA synthetase (NDP forming)